MKKKLIILIIFIALLPLAFMSGKSSWIILDEVDKEIDNTYYPVAVAPTFNEVYDGNYKEITVEDCSSATVKYDPSLLLIEYYDSANKKIGNKRANKPVNAGVYYAKTYYNSKLIGTTEMVIQEYPIYVVPNSYEISFGDATSSIDPGYRLCDLASGSYVERELFTNVEAGTRDTLNLIKGESFNYTYTYKQYANVGSYEIGIDIINESVLNPNYSVTVGTSSELNVSKRALGFSWNQLEYTYDGTIHTPSITISNNLAEPHALKPIINGNVLKDAGTYPVTLQKEYDNFILNGEDADFSRNVVINKRNVLKGGASWANTALTYNGKPQAPTITFDNIVEGEVVAPVYEYYSGATKLAGMPTNAGSYIVKLTGISGADSKNYKFTPLEQSFTIERAMPNKPEVAVLQAKVGDLVSSVKLPEGFSLRGYQPTDKFTTEGRQNINVIYNPDSNNYKDLNTTLVVDVIKADAKVISVAIESATITYDGKPHKLSYTLKLNGEPIGALPSGVTLTIWFSDTATDCTNVGVYMVKRISLVGEGYELDGASKAEATKASLTITPLEVRLASSSYDLNYDASVRSWAQMQAKLASTIVLNNDSTGNAVSLPAGAIIIDGMHNGVYKYGNVTRQGLSTAEANVVGSTYLVTIRLNNNNYKLVGESSFILKYKTAKIGGTLYTIEDAILTGSGEINFCGNASNTTSYVVTSFTRLTLEEGNPYNNGKIIQSYYSMHRNMVVPYGEGCGSGDRNRIHDATGTISAVYSALVIPAGVTIEFGGGAVFSIGSVITSSTVVGQHGVVINEGKIIMNSSTKIDCYGYLKGKNGLIEMKPGSEIVDQMRLYNWPGGSNASQIYTKVFPISSWSLHNVSCRTRVHSGAVYTAGVFIVAMKTEFEKFVTVLGTKSSKNYLFKPTGDTGYIEKYSLPAEAWKEGTSYYNELYSITGTNQRQGQRDVIEINGDYVDGNLLIEISVFLVINVKIGTSLDKACPLSFVSVVANNGTNLKLTKSDYVFLPGTYFKIHKGASVTIGAGVDMSFATMASITNADAEASDQSFLKACVDKVDAYLELDGDLTCSGNIGGHIKTTTAKAKLNISGAGLTSNFQLLNSISGNIYFLSSVNADGPLAAGGANTALAKSIYISQGEGENAYWIEATDVKNFHFIFYDDDGVTEIGRKDIQLINQPSYNVTGDEYLPTKRYYDFNGWVNLDGTPIVGQEVLPDSTTKMKAQWSYHQFTISYAFGYGLNPADNKKPNYVKGTLVGTIVDKFTYEDIRDGKTLQITTLAEYSVNGVPKYFDGWYPGLDKSSGVKIKAIDERMMNLVLDQFPGMDDIPLFCDFRDDKVFNVLFNPNHPINHGLIPKTIVVDNNTKVEGYQLFEEFDANPNEKYFFEGWYTNRDCTNKFDFNTPITADMVLFGKWTAKHEIRLMQGTELNKTLGVISGLSLFKTFYIKDGQTVKLDLPKVGDENLPIEKGHTFTGWDVKQVIDATPKYGEGNSIGAELTYTNSDIVLYAAYNVNSYNVNVQNTKYGETLLDPGYYSLTSIKVGQTDITANGTTLVKYGGIINIDVNWGRYNTYVADIKDANGNMLQKEACVGEQKKGGSIKHFNWQMIYDHDIIISGHRR